MKQFFLALGLFAALATTPAQAASQDECAIWICLPGAFLPSGCGAAKSAMIKRIKKLKSPLPSFSSCAANPPSGSGSHMTSTYGFAAFVPAHKVCSRYSDHDDPQCFAWGMVPDRYIKYTQCQMDGDGERHPRGCTRTYRWAEVFVDGQLAGPTYYW